MSCPVCPFYRSDCGNGLRFSIQSDKQTGTLQQKASISSGLSGELAQVQTLDHSGFIPKGRLMLCNIGRVGDTILSNSILDAAFRTYATVDYLCGKGNERILRSDSRLNQVT